MSKILTIDERLDKYVDFCFDVATLVKAHSDGEDAAKSKAFDRVSKRTIEFIREAQTWSS